MYIYIYIYIYIVVWLKTDSALKQGGCWASGSSHLGSSTKPFKHSQSKLVVWHPWITRRIFFCSGSRGLTVLPLSTHCAEAP